MVYVSAMMQKSNRIKKIDLLTNSDHSVLSVKLPINEFNRIYMIRQSQSSARHFKLYTLIL